MIPYEYRLNGMTFTLCVMTKNPTHFNDCRDKAIHYLYDMALSDLIEFYASISQQPYELILNDGLPNVKIFSGVGITP